MAKLVLNDITNIDTAVNALNTNFTLIEQAVENTVSRNGTSPNQLTADLDLNSQDILNCGTITAADAIIGGSSVAGSAAAAAASANSAQGFANIAVANAAVAVSAQTSASASAAVVADWDYIGNWTTAILYKVNNIVYNTTEGNSYICIAQHTSGIFGDDYSAGKWGLLAIKGAAGAGTGDMLKSENLSGLTDYATARANLGVAIGTNVQAQDATLQALAGTLTTANKIPYATALDTAGELDFNANTALSASVTTIPSQTVVKTAIDDLIANCSVATPDASTDYFIFEDATDNTQKKALINSVPQIGSGQTWQNVTASRTVGSPYTNTTGKPIQISVNVYILNNGTVSLTVSGIVIGQVAVQIGAAPNANLRSQLTAIIPNGETYSITVAGSPTITSWNELR